jgi:hypothetical protein
MVNESLSKDSVGDLGLDLIFLADVVAADD